MRITLTPAYGRDYKSAKEALADWSNGKDFIINAIGHQYDGKYVNNEEPGDYTIRYNKLRKTVNVEN